jgi:hypothetical protein
MEMLVKNFMKLNVWMPLTVGFGTFIFFAFFYPFHIQYQEQFQLFLFTRDYFMERVSEPGGLAMYIGNFFTQFFFYSWMGALILAGLLVLLQQQIAWLTTKVGMNHAFYPLTILPSFAFWVLFFDESYLLSGLLLLLMILAAVMACTLIASRRIRLILTVCLIPFLYVLCGGCFWLFPLMMLLIDRFGFKNSGDLSWWLTLMLSVGISVATPLGAQYFYQYPLERLWLGIGMYRFPNIEPFGQICVWLLVLVVVVLPRFLPTYSATKKYRVVVSLQVALLVIAGGYVIKHFANWEKEEIMAYDRYVRMQEWNKIIDMADKKAPTAPMSVASLNLALAKIGILPDRMFAYYQNGVRGLLPPFEADFTTPLPTGEIYYQLGMINTAQRFAFEAMESIPDYQKSGRCFKRLAETNLINGQYEVAAKYLRALQHTLFYRSWATNTLTYLYNEKRINSHPEWGRLRQLRFQKDFLYSENELDVMLGILFLQNKSNKMAYEYLMACALLSKNLDHFTKYFPLGSDLKYAQIPKSYQEALIFIWSLKHLPQSEPAPWPISQQTTDRLLIYAPIYMREKDAESTLKERFGDTYWYYLHFGAKKQ